MAEVWIYSIHVGDCQNYGPFLGPYYNTGPHTGPNLGDPKGTIILTIPHVPSAVTSGTAACPVSLHLPGTVLIRTPHMHA